MFKTSRRKFFAIAGSAPLAAKATIDNGIGKLAGMGPSNGLGMGGLGIQSGLPEGEIVQGSGVYMPYEEKLIKAGEYIKIFGVPDWMEFQMRDNAKYVGALDSDLACKRSWSMAVKIAEQRQRNYNRRIEYMERCAYHERGKSILKKFLGFNWPF